MRHQITHRRGQALLLVTLALIAMFGLMGLAVDVGWSYFVKRSAQRAADAAALGAAKAAYATVSAAGPFACSANPCTPGQPCLVCQTTPLPCSSITAGSNLYNGCQYAAQNGFSATGSQMVRMTADVSSPFQTRTGPINVHYWVTATVVETVPQLFAAVLGNGTASIAATATAAITDVTVPGSLIVLDRANDPTAMSQVPGGQMQYGVNLMVQANDNQGMKALQTAGGIRLSSDCGPNTPWSSTSCSNGGNTHFYAGENQGSGTVQAAETRIRGQGWYQLGGGAKWVPTPTNGYSTGFNDPMAGKGQPPPSLTGQTWVARPVLSGVISASFCQGLSGVSGQCPPGQYFATEVIKGVLRATGAPLQIQDNITFTSGPTGFGNFAFYGGIKRGSGGQASVRFEPGIYTFAGALASGNSPGILLDTSTNFTLRDNTASTGQNSDAGALFIFTNGTYTDANGVAQLPQPVHQTWTDRVTGLETLLQYGTVNLQAGNNNTYINLHGLNPDHPLIKGTPLETFAPAFIWWDRGNSSVKHDIYGQVVTSPSCGGGGTLDTPCFNTLADVKSPELDFQASPSVNLYGTVSQPRGAWTTMIGGGGYSGPLQLITGALQVKANSNVNLVVPERTVTITIVSLIQ